MRTTARRKHPRRTKGGLTTVKKHLVSVSGNLVIRIPGELSGKRVGKVTKIALPSGLAGQKKKIISALNHSSAEYPVTAEFVKSGRMAFKMPEHDSITVAELPIERAFNMRSKYYSFDTPTSMVNVKYSPKQFSALKGAVKSNKQFVEMIPVSARDIHSDVIGEGRHRILAAKEAGLKSIPVQLVGSQEVYRDTRGEGQSFPEWLEGRGVRVIRKPRGD